MSQLGAFVEEECPMVCFVINVWCGVIGMFRGMWQ